MTLDAVQLRVLGSLIEKEITTPENYPLSLNSLIAACNQRSSRDPVLDLNEEEVRQAVHSLEDMGIVAPVRDARVPKYEHRIRTVLNLRRDETAILCLLILRGPQTPGELRGRADRMYSFDELAAVQSTLERLANRGAQAANDSDSAETERSAERPLVVMLPRQPGSRESRYAHLLGGPVAAGDASRSLAGSSAYQAAGSRKTADLAEPTIEVMTGLEARLLARIEAVEGTLKELQLRVQELEGIELESAPLLEPRAGQR